MLHVRDGLNQAGIQLRNIGAGNHKTFCPKCHHTRKNKHDQSLSVTVSADGVVWKCHSCEWSTPAFDKENPDPFYVALYGLDERPRRSNGNGRHSNDGPEEPPPHGSEAPPAERQDPAPKAPPVRPKWNPPPMPVAGYAWFEKRKISKATVDAAGVTVTTAWMPGPNKEVKCYAFPYRRHGQVVNVKYRDGDKHFRQEKGAEKVFYGLETVGPDTEAAIVVEGEIDKLSLDEAGLHEYARLSVPDGAPKQFRWENGERGCKVHAAIVDPGTMTCPSCGATRMEKIDPEDDAKFEYVWNCLDDLRGIKKFIIAVDMDAAGQILAEELARRLGKERCWRVRWPDLNDVQRKDANEVLVEDGDKVLRECIEQAQPYPIRGLHRAGDFRTRMEAVYLAGRSRGLSTGWDSVDEHVTVVPGQYWVVTGVPGSGKSEWLDALTVNLAVNFGWTFAMASFENDPAEDHLPKLLQKKLGIPFFDGPTPRMTPTERDAAMAWVDRHYAFLVAEDESPTIDWILEKTAAAVTRFGIRGLVIDPYNEVEHKRPKGMSETEYVSQLIGKCKRFARTKGVTVFQVAHPMKLMRQKDGSLPVPTLYDISGSAHWHNKADVGIVVHREWEEKELVNGAVVAGLKDEADIWVKKVRYSWVGRTGVVSLHHNGRTGRYEERG